MIWRGRREALESTWSLELVRGLWGVCAVMLRGRLSATQGSSLVQKQNKRKTVWPLKLKPQTICLVGLKFWISVWASGLVFHSILLIMNIVCLWLGDFPPFLDQWKLHDYQSLLTLNNSNHLCNQRKHAMPRPLNNLELFFLVHHSKPFYLFLYEHHLACLCLWYRSSVLPLLISHAAAEPKWVFRYAALAPENGNEPDFYASRPNIFALKETKETLLT